MRRITLWLLSTIAGLVLVFSYRTSTMGAGGDQPVAAAATPAPQPTATDEPADPAPDPTHPTSAPTPSSPSSSSPTSSSPSSSSSASSSPTPASPSSSSGTFSGSTVQTRWGPIQVSITVRSGKITDVAVPVYPQGNQRDIEINSYALPALRESTLSAQSAQIDGVSGATVTSDGYKQSLQAALDAAQLA